MLIDKFLEDAIEVDVDAVGDGETTVVGGVMEHIEEAGVHSGDSACALPPYSLPPSVIEEIKVATRPLATELQVRGLMNIQFAVKRGEGPGTRVQGQEPSSLDPGSLDRLRPRSEPPRQPHHARSSARRRAGAWQGSRRR